MTIPLKLTDPDEPNLAASAVVAFQHQYRLLLGVCATMLIMMALTFAFTAYSIEHNREGIRCMVAQQAEHRYANRAAHVAEAEYNGYTYEIPEELAPPTEEEAIQIAKKLDSACADFR